MVLHRIQQNQYQKKGVVVLKIKKDNNGKTTVIDTTFTITTPFDHKELEEYLKKHEEELGNSAKSLKILRSCLTYLICLIPWPMILK